MLEAAGEVVAACLQELIDAAFEDLASTTPGRQSWTIDALDRGGAAVADKVMGIGSFTNG